ncbi:hypothetical protein C8R44DRAFT_785719 [Mycena epipterygia]|nr:hypothetical protein C8R44DRAFT_785719 [Mycena epipterygia]
MLPSKISNTRRAAAVRDTRSLHPPTMQRYPPSTMQQQQYPYPSNPTLKSAMKRPHGNTTKYTTADSTRSVWGGSTVADSDNGTVTAQTTSSVASSRSLAPGNKPAQQRRVAHWVHTTNHHTAEFKSPFVPRSRDTTPTPIASSAKSNHHHRSGRKEPPPVWVPQSTVQHPVQRAVSQPIVGMQQPYQYPQPQMVWISAPAMPVPAVQPQMNLGMGMRSNPIFAVPSRTSTAVVYNGGGNSKGDGRKRSH